MAPNGFHGSQKEWRRLEAPYLQIDPILASFAERHGLEVYKNYRAADRSLRFNDSLSRTIWVHATDKYGTKDTYEVSIVAHQDRPERYLKVGNVSRAVPLQELERTLERAANLVASWSVMDLQLITYKGAERELILAERFRDSSAYRVWIAWLRDRIDKLFKRLTQRRRQEF